jgi:hypothetical protein
VGILFAPWGGELALEGLFEEGLAIDAELPPRPPQTLLPGVEFGEELFDLRNNPLLLVEGWERKRDFPNNAGIEIYLCYALLVHVPKKRANVIEEVEKELSGNLTR